MDGLPLISILRNFDFLIQHLIFTLRHEIGPTIELLLRSLLKIIVDSRFFFKIFWIVIPRSAQFDIRLLMLICYNSLELWFRYERFSKLSELGGISLMIGRFVQSGQILLILAREFRIIIDSILHTVCVELLVYLHLLLNWLPL